MQTIGENIRKFRNERHLSQKRLAELTGLNEVTIRSYEANKYRPKYENVLKLASALNIQPHQLIHYDECGVNVNNISYPDGCKITLSQVLNDLLSDSEQNIHDINQYMSNCGYQDFDVKKIMNGIEILNCENASDRKLFDTLCDFFWTDTNIVFLLEDGFYNHPVRQDLLNNSVEEHLNFLDEVDCQHQSEIKNYIIYVYNSMNSDGQEKLCEFAKMLSKIDEYKKKDN